MSSRDLIADKRVKFIDAPLSRILFKIQKKITTHYHYNIVIRNEDFRSLNYKTIGSSFQKLSIKNKHIGFITENYSLATINVVEEILCVLDKYSLIYNKINTKKHKAINQVRSYIENKQNLNNTDGDEYLSKQSYNNEDEISIDIVNDINKDLTSLMERKIEEVEKYYEKELNSSIDWANRMISSYCKSYMREGWRAISDSNCEIKRLLEKYESEENPSNDPIEHDEFDMYEWM